MRRTILAATALGCTAVAEESWNEGALIGGGAAAVFAVGGGAVFVVRRRRTTVRRELVSIG